MINKRIKRLGLTLIMDSLFFKILEFVINKKTYPLH
jgi:hypothetical protein